MADNTQDREDFKRTLSTAIGLQPFMSYEHNERLIEGAKRGSGSRYQEQFDRVKRLYAQFKLINQGIPLPRSLDFDKDKVYQPYWYFFDAIKNPERLGEDWWLAICQDQVYAFFQNCYHLKDWIKHDTSIRVSENVEDFIKKYCELKLCKVICNGTKHLVLKMMPLGGRKTIVDVGRGTTTIRVEYIIDASGGPYDAFKLATKCLDRWETFIRERVQSKTGTK